MEELEEIVAAQRDAEMRQFKFAASLKGIDIDAETGEEEEQSSFDKVVERAKNKLTDQGIAQPTDEAQILAKIGIKIEKD